MNGFLVIDKPAGITSFDVVSRVRRALSIKKVGHMGTLDPLATGVLVLAVGEGTKLIEYFMGSDKEYEAQLELGKVSDTYDREGIVDVIDSSPTIIQQALEQALKAFVGDIQQIPPAFSAIKVNGKRAYDLARRGESVALKPRPVYVQSIDVVDFQAPHATLDIVCGSGTYVRSIIHDVGQALQCGAIMTELRRTRVGKFTLSDATDLKSPQLTSLEKVVSDWPPVVIDDTQLLDLHHGRPIRLDGNYQPPHTDTIFAIFHDDRLVSLGEMSNGWLHPHKNFVVN